MPSPSIQTMQMADAAIASAQLRQPANRSRPESSDTLECRKVVLRFPADTAEEHLESAAFRRPRDPPPPVSFVGWRCADSIAAGVGEEVLFRVRSSRGSEVVLMAVLFGALHVHTRSPMIMIVFPGIALGVLKNRRRPPSPPGSRALRRGRLLAPRFTRLGGAGVGGDGRDVITQRVDVWLGGLGVLRTARLRRRCRR
jgi:hypothetical protein